MPGQQQTNKRINSLLLLLLLLTSVQHLWALSIHRHCGGVVAFVTQPQQQQEQQQQQLKRRVVTLSFVGSYKPHVFSSVRTPQQSVAANGALKVNAPAAAAAFAVACGSSTSRRKPLTATAGENAADAAADDTAAATTWTDAVAAAAAHEKATTATTTNGAATAAHPPPATTVAHPSPATTAAHPPAAGTAAYPAAAAQTPAAPTPADAAAAAEAEETAEAAAAAAALEAVAAAVAAAGEDGKTNHILCDAEIFKKKQFLRERIDEIQQSGVQTVSAASLQPIRDLLLEGRLIEDVFRLIRSALIKNIRPVPASAADAAAAAAAAAVGGGMRSTAGGWLGQHAAAQSAGGQQQQQQLQREQQEKAEEASKASAAALQKLNRIEMQIMQHTRVLRRRVAAQKTERLLGLMLLGKPHQLDELMDRLSSLRGLDEHFMHFLNEKIREAMNSNPPKTRAAMALRILRQRCTARLRLDAVGKAKFVEILAKAFQDPNADLRALANTSLHTTEEIEDFCEWLQSGIAFGKETKRLSPAQLRTMQQLLTDTASLHPAEGQFLDRWTEGMTFKPNAEIQRIWDEIPNPPKQQQQEQQQEQQQPQQEQQQQQQDQQGKQQGPQGEGGWWV